MFRKAPLFSAAVLLLLVLAVLELSLPPRFISRMENRSLSQPPVWTIDSFLSGSFSKAAENFSADQMPARDLFVSVYALMDAAQGKTLRGDILFGKNGYLFEKNDALSENNVRLNTQAFSTLLARTGASGVMMLVPSSACLYPGLLPAFSPVADEQKLLRLAASGKAVWIDVLAALKAVAQDEPLYYKTDHHWTAGGAYTGYLALCASLGYTPFVPDPQRVQTFGPFYGSYFVRSPSPFIRGDTLKIDETPGLTLWIGNEKKDALYDEKAIAGRDKYAALLYGNHAEITLRNSACASGTLLVIKDSYANALLPYLAMNNAVVYAVDPRYFQGDIVKYTKQRKVDQIVCLYGLSTFAQSRNLALMEGL